MRKLTTLLLISLLFCSSAFSMGNPPEKPESLIRTDAVTKASSYKPLQNKTVLMIVPSKDFQDKEYSTVKRILEKYGAKIIIASSTLDEIIGLKNTKVKPDILLKNAKVKNYNGFVFIGGPGVSEYYENTSAHNIATWGYALRKPVGAICLAPVVLAKSGLLGGKKATVYKEKADILTDEGAIYTGADVEVFGHLITADGPASAEKFAKAIVNALSK